MKKSRNLHLNNSIWVMKIENDWRYFGRVVAGNYVIYLKNFSVVKDFVRISPYMTFRL